MPTVESTVPTVESTVLPAATGSIPGLKLSTSILKTLLKVKERPVYGIKGSLKNAAGQPVNYKKYFLFHERSGKFVGKYQEPLEGTLTLTASFKKKVFMSSDIRFALDGTMTYNTLELDTTFNKKSDIGRLTVKAGPVFYEYRIPGFTFDATTMSMTGKPTTKRKPFPYLLYPRNVPASVMMPKQEVFDESDVFEFEKLGVTDTSWTISYMNWTISYMNGDPVAKMRATQNTVSGVTTFAYYVNVKNNEKIPKFSWQVAGTGAYDGKYLVEEAIEAIEAAEEVFFDVTTGKYAKKSDKDKNDIFDFDPFDGDDPFDFDPFDGDAPAGDVRYSYIALPAAGTGTLTVVADDGEEDRAISATAIIATAEVIDSVSDPAAAALWGRVTAAASFAGFALAVGTHSFGNSDKEWVTSDSAASVASAYSFSGTFSGSATTGVNRFINPSSDSVHTPINGATYSFDGPGRLLIVDSGASPYDVTVTVDGETGAAGDDGTFTFTHVF